MLLCALVLRPLPPARVMPRPPGCPACDVGDTAGRGVPAGGPSPAAGPLSPRVTSFPSTPPSAPLIAAGLRRNPGPVSAAKWARLQRSVCLSISL